MSETTPASGTPTTPEATESANYSDFLELDLAPTGTPLALVLAAIVAVFVGTTRASIAAARVALALAIEPARTWPEGSDRATARTALLAKRAEIERAELLLPAALVPAPVALVAEYVIQASLPVALTSMVPMASVTHEAQWARIRTGALAGDWGATVATGTVKIGDRLRVFRAAGGAPTLKRVATIITNTARGTLVSVADENAAIPTVTDAPLATGTAPIAAPVEIVAESAQEPTSAPDTLEAALGAAVSEGASIATSVQQGASAHAARLGVGFSDPAQYLTALRNGGLQPHTRAGYLATVRAAGLTFDEASLPPANAPSTGASTGGVVHQPISSGGKTWFQMNAAERTEHAKRVKLAAETRTEMGKILDAGQLIGGAVAAGGFLQVSWVGGGVTTVGKIRDKFTERGLRYEAPTGPSSERHAGRAVDSLKGRGMDTTRLPSNDLPNGIAARWLVGTKLTGKTIKAGDSYGNAALIVSLTDGDALTFDGDQSLADACRAHFTNATAHEVLRSEDLTAWYAATLKREHYAVKRAHNWYVPGGEVDAARALSDALGELWGDHETMPVTTGADLGKSLARGLTDEISKVAKEYDNALATAQDRAADKASKEHIAEYIEHNKRAARAGRLQMADAVIAASAATAGDTARNSARVSATVAARLLLDLGKIAARVEGYRVVLGDESTTGARTAMIALRDVLEALCSDGDQRTAMLELS